MELSVGLSGCPNSLGLKTKIGNTISACGEISCSPALYELLAASPPSKSIETEGRAVVVVIVVIIIVGDIKCVPSRGTRARTRSGSEAKAAKRIWSATRSSHDCRGKRRGGREEGERVERRGEERGRPHLSGVVPSGRGCGRGRRSRASKWNVLHHAALKGASSRATNPRCDG